MSQENFEVYRAYIEDILAGTSELDPEATISKMAERWDRADFEDIKRQLTGPTR